MHGLNVMAFVRIPSMRLLLLISATFACLFSSECSSTGLPSASDESRTTEKGLDSTRDTSVFLFAGRLSTTSLGSTLKFNVDHASAQTSYDNYISGVALARDFFRPGWGFTLGAEIGGAVRAGPYASCCDPAVMSSSWVHSEELWGGPRVSHEGFVLFGSVRIAGAVTWGLSFTDRSIGFERGREIAWDGSARTLFYFGPEIIVSLPDHPDVEFVYREHHRSGANGTLGNLREGYNANVFGLRYKF